MGTSYSITAGKIIFITALTFFVLFAMSMIILFIKRSHILIKVNYYKLISKITKIYTNLLLLKKISKEVQYNFYSHSVETVLQMFSFFYETNFKDIENWGLITEYFPHGKADLTHLYRWIRKTRIENYNELHKLEFDFENNCFHYWGTKYKTFRFKITKYGELKIIPVEISKSKNLELSFRNKKVKMENALYDLDTKMCLWIIERRKFLLL